MRPQFCIGTIKYPVDSDSHARRGKWSVNCVNGWVATLGQKLTVETAIRRNNITVIHELTHIMSEERSCSYELNSAIVWSENILHWDEFIKNHVVD